MKIQNYYRFFAEEYFIEKIKKEPDNYLNKILLAEVYLRNDKAYEATKVLKSLGDKATTSSFVMYRLAEAYSRAKNQTDYDKEMENIKNTDPESFYALELLYNEAMNSEKYIDADSICSKVKKHYGTNETTDPMGHQYCSKNKKTISALSTLASNSTKNIPIMAITCTSIT